MARLGTGDYRTGGVRRLSFPQEMATISRKAPRLDGRRAGCASHQVMNAPSLYVLKKLALVVGLAAHVMLPIATAAAPATFDIASLICAPTGKVSPEAKAALTEMLRLAGEDVPDETDETVAKGHCGACVISACALAPSPQLALPFVFADARRNRALARDNVYSSVHGPPLGLRAPPVSLTAI